ncbi:molybdate ABC transporter substrate-binding protein [Prauserella muralis]|uniref:Molybdate ABC transporter substrate-binding protein n=1 Tax=Prauserella muralis TaxID=588067 RepID=A0A2V4B6Y7_9PSEU|nr:molybdate ABC transporter substrate-binding protein [Prauserella muralis]PXY30987.1 molybdate ABC transporter substrate-binding protein [Prauserella muralis]TWE14750.1 molybdate transport system substrate-binding protein [Prauserella muralis]
MKKVLALALAAVLTASACGTSSGEGERTLRVFAAASLTEVFGALEQRFEDDHPGVDVQLNLAGSSRLAQQINEGAPADVFAAADEASMGIVRQTGALTGDPMIFAYNRMTIAVQPGNPKNINYFTDLQRPDLTVVVCAPQVPCGAATQKLQQNTGVVLNPVSEEQDVKAVLNKVAMGEADAGMVYHSDVVSAAGKVEGIEFARSSGAINRYPIAVLAETGQPDLAGAFRDLVFSETGKAELRKAGFGTR